MAQKTLTKDLPKSFLWVDTSAGSPSYPSIIRLCIMSLALTLFPHKWLFNLPFTCFKSEVITQLWYNSPIHKQRFSCQWWTRLCLHSVFCTLHTVQNLVGFHVHGYIFYEEDYTLLCTSNAKLTCMIYLIKNSFFVQSGSQIHKKTNKLCQRIHHLDSWLFNKKIK